PPRVAAVATRPPVLRKSRREALDWGSVMDILQLCWVDDRSGTRRARRARRKPAWRRGGSGTRFRDCVEASRGCRTENPSRGPARPPIQQVFILQDGSGLSTSHLGIFWGS